MKQVWKPVARVAVFLALMGVTDRPARGQSAEGPSDCPGSGDCCVAHGLPGCDSIGCCETVCGADFFCCIGWGSDCVLLAEELCGSLCGGGNCPGTGDCCTAHASPGCDNALCCDLVCTATPACCSGTWSAACANLAVAICDVCEPPIVCPMQGDCCGYNFTPGCDRKGCCELICIELGDEFCCRGKWDLVCARKAGENCPNVCDCETFGELSGDGVVDLRDFAKFSNCFTGPGGSVPDPCACADYDGDDDVDAEDVDPFVNAWHIP